MHFTPFLLLLSAFLAACTQATNTMDSTHKIEPLKIIGISVRTTNEGGQAAKDLGQLWQQFYVRGVQEQIPNKENGDVYAVYTNYESD